MVAVEWVELDNPALFSMAPPMPSCRSRRRALVAVNVLPVTSSVAPPKLSMPPPTLPPKKEEPPPPSASLPLKVEGRDDGAAQVQQAAAEDIDGVGGSGGLVVVYGILI